MTDPKPTRCPLTRITVYWCDSALGIHYDNSQGTWNGSRKVSEEYVRADLYAELQDANIALAAEFQASDAIARRRALEAAADELAWALSVIEHEVKPPESCGACGTPNAACDGNCADAAYWSQHMRSIRALLRAPTSEKAEETKAKCKRCGGTGVLGVPEYGLEDCPACSPPADGGGG